MNKSAHLLIQSWAGLEKFPIIIVGETKKKYRIRWILDDPFVTPRSRTLRYRDDVFLVPKHAVRL